MCWHMRYSSSRLLPGIVIRHFSDLGVLIMHRHLSTRHSFARSHHPAMSNKSSLNKFWVLLCPVLKLQLPLTHSLWSIHTDKPTSISRPSPSHYLCILLLIKYLLYPRQIPSSHCLPLGSFRGTRGLPAGFLLRFLCRAFYIYKTKE